MNIEETKEKIIQNLKGVQDPEMGCDVYNLGLIYDIVISAREHEVTITHTLTSAFCPFADQIVADIREAGYVENVRSVQIVTTFDPPFSMDMVPEETRMMLGWM